MLTHPVHGQLEAWQDAQWDAMRKVVTYDTFYQLAGAPDPIHAQSRIGFVGQPRLARLIQTEGLQVDRWMGDWDGRAFAPDALEIIAMGRLSGG